MANDSNNLLQHLQQEPLDKGQPQAKAANPPRGAQADALLDQYHYYYDRIYLLLKEGKLDFQRIASKTGLKERRVRETLLFRLTSGEVMQLFGCKNGFCYICGYKTHSPSNKEPVCINCLKTLDTAIQEIHMAEIAEHQKTQVTFEIPALTDLPHLNLTEELAEDFQVPDFSEAEAISRLEYEQVLHELNRYRRLFGPLPKPETTMPSIDTADTPEIQQESTIQSEEPTDSEPVEDSEGMLQYISEIDPLLQMLKLNDRDVIAEGIDVSNLFSNDPIRHFGFQRVKGGNT